MIKVTGETSLRVRFTVEVDMTEEQWDNLSEKNQNTMLDDVIDWKEDCRSAEVDEFEVWDVNEVSNG